MPRVWIYGCVLGLTLWSAIAAAQQQALDLPAVNHCRAEAESHPSRSQLINIWLDRAQRKNGLAAFCLSYVPSEKLEVPVSWLEQAAHLGLPDAQLLLGSNYEVGLSFKQDFAEALVWYRKAADQDFPYAEFELAAIYFEGRAGQKKNPTEAYFWALLAKRHQFLSADKLLQVLEPKMSEAEKKKVHARIDRWVQKPSRGHVG